MDRLVHCDLNLLLFFRKKGKPGFEHVLVHIAGKKVEGRIRPTANLMRLLAKMTTQQVHYVCVCIMVNTCIVFSLHNLGMVKYFGFHSI